MDIYGISINGCIQEKDLEMFLKHTNHTQKKHKNKGILEADRLDINILLLHVKTRRLHYTVYQFTLRNSS